MKQQTRPVSLQLASTAINAALYAGIGVLSATLPTFYGVRFWPQVFVPASFSVLFGPWTGGVGAAIGIFLADVLYGHHDALLSLLVGVPSNFLGFYILGWLTHRSAAGIVRRALLVVSLLFPASLAGYGIYLLSRATSSAPGQFIVALVGIVAVVAIVGLTVFRNKWADFEIAASIGLGVGSIIIGLGIVAYSSIFTLPVVLGLGREPLPTTFIYATIAFTYLSEIPFLVLLTPPVVAACRAAFPALHVSKGVVEAKPIKHPDKIS